MGKNILIILLGVIMSTFLMGCHGKDEKASIGAPKDNGHPEISTGDNNSSEENDLPCTDDDDDEVRDYCLDGSREFAD